jgi:hypothetical protein
MTHAAKARDEAPSAPPHRLRRQTVRTSSDALPVTEPVAPLEFQEGLARVVSLLEREGRSQLLDKADQIARLVIEVTPPSDALIRERTARLKTIACLFAETQWFTAQQIHDLQPRPPKNPSAPASDWKRRGKIYAVSWDGKEYFPAYQFSEAVQPLPVIGEVLAQFGEVADTWQIAAWFHFPNGWLAAGDPGHAQRARAPRDCLDEREALLQAVRHRRGSYQA